MFQDGYVKNPYYIDEKTNEVLEVGKKRIHILFFEIYLFFEM